ncbi:MAG: FtsQ-type POTRA domain-containing protein [Gemmatimonadetes bacterium]|nr:FtsQ-type POTRA domain-containing protein [Gemmatimonadota bacterium]
MRSRKRWMGAALVTLAAAGLLAFGVRVVRAAPGWLAQVPLFDVSTVRVEGTDLVDDREILARAAIPDTANVWHDATSWEAAVAAHPMVRRARIRTRWPSTLVVKVEEREPVAFVATPVLELVDAEGRLLPLDPTMVILDLPVVRLDEAGSSGEVPSPGRLQDLIQAVVRLGENPHFHGRLSELREEPDGTVTALWGSSPGLEVLMRLPIDPGLVDEGLDVLTQALAGDSIATPSYLDLRWADQVVVGYGSD